MNSQFDTVIDSKLDIGHMIRLTKNYVLRQTGNVMDLAVVPVFSPQTGCSLPPGVQPYKYGGKELDRTGGLDAYDFGARSYFADRLQWSTMDPLCEKYYDVTPYGYCLNSPINMVDLFGEKPGDFFKTMDDAAIDFGLFYNDNSIRENREYNSSIIVVFNNAGEQGYTYTLPSLGIDEKSTKSKEWGFISVAFVHTHSAYSVEHRNNQFSGLYLKDKDGNPVRFLTIQERKMSNGKGDIGSANVGKQIAYVATPNGSLQKYDNVTGCITVISNDMPSDRNDPDRLNTIGTEERHANQFDYDVYSRTIKQYRLNYLSNLYQLMK